MVAKISKGSFIVVKSPPYYRDEYLYQITSAGEKVIRASLYHSPKVKKSWSVSELNLLIKMGIVRLACAKELPLGSNQP